MAKFCKVRFRNVPWLKADANLRETYEARFRNALLRPFGGSAELAEKAQRECESAEKRMQGVRYPPETDTAAVQPWADAWRRAVEVVTENWTEPDLPREGARPGELGVQIEVEFIEVPEDQGSSTER